MFGKKADVGMGVIFLIFIIILFFVWAITYSQKECRNDGDCKKNSYCGSDFSCHAHPVIIQEKIVSQSGSASGSNYTAAAFLLGLSLVVAAIIMRSKNGNNSSPSLSRPHHSHDERDLAARSSQAFEHYGSEPPTHGPPKHH